MSEKNLAETVEYDLEKTIERFWSTISPNADTIELRPGSTIEPARLAQSKASKLVEGVALSEGLERRLRIEGTLGQGGMGLVHLATQLSIGRKVAVKTLRSERRDDESCSLALLREAWITGAVEHPNVVPVHDIGADGNGTPFIASESPRRRPWSTRSSSGSRRRPSFPSPSSGGSSRAPSPPGGDAARDHLDRRPLLLHGRLGHGADDQHRGDDLVAARSAPRRGTRGRRRTGSGALAPTRSGPARRGRTRCGRPAARSRSTRTTSSPR